MRERRRTLGLPAPPHPDLPTAYADRLVVEIANGADFRVNPTGAGPPEERGLGLPLMVAMVDEVQFVKTSDRGTIVRLTMLFGSSA